MVKYWMHNNMITINGQKMGKSLGNFITLEQFFKGTHHSLNQAYSPMTIRFFILSAHYRGTVDFSNEALLASQKGLERLMNGINDLERIQPSDKCDEQTKQVVSQLRQKCYDAMNDDLSTSCVGQVHGAMVSQVGTASVLRWVASIWAITLTSTEVVWT